MLCFVSLEVIGVHSLEDKQIMKYIFVTSDHHFFHRNIIDYENRPFPNITTMNDVMIHRWNSIISDDDIVVHLGDFALTNFDNTKEVFDKLNGRKYLIMGNHDNRRSKGWWRRIGFLEVFPELQVDDYILTHKPIPEGGIPDGKTNIHGHCHTKEYFGQENPQYWNVCVENTAFFPVPLLVSERSVIFDS